MPYSSSAEAIAPSSRYFMPASLDRWSFPHPARMYCGMEDSSSARKIVIRSRAPARNISPAEAVRTSAKYSDCRRPTRSTQSIEAMTTIAVIPANTYWKKTAYWSIAKVPSKAVWKSPRMTHVEVQMAAPRMPARAM